MATKKEFFIAALKAEAYRYRGWVFNVFAKTKETGKAVKYPYHVFETDKGKYAFNDPMNGDQLTIIEDSDTNVPLLNHKERAVFTKEDAINIKQDIETTYGKMFYNYVSLIYPFGNKIEFTKSTGRFNVGEIEDIIANRLVDDPEEGQPHDPNVIYCYEAVKFGNSQFFLTAFTQLWVPGATKKTMTVNPELIKLRDKLLEENKERLHDPAVLADIEKQLIQFDRDWFKGDLAEGFLIKDKSFNIVRKKLYIMYGAEAGLEDKVEINPITKSLSEGWDISRFPDMNNALRAGSFNRGAQTVFGGVEVKWLLRASSNMNITEDDCGAKVGFPTFITEENYKNFVGRYYLDTNKKPVLIDDENAKSLLNKLVQLRSAQFCQLDKTDYCKVCVGKRLSDHPHGVSAAVSDYGSTFLYIFMGAMHGKALQTSRLEMSEFK